MIHLRYFIITHKVFMNIIININDNFFLSLAFETDTVHLKQV